MRAGGGAPQDSATAGWVEEDAPGRDLVGNRGRLFDLIVVGRPVRNSATPTMSLLEAALFETGRPILIAPPKPPGGLGTNIIISWNGSYETPRCISFGMPMLQAAEKVTVLQVEEGMVPGPTAADATIHLRRNGVAAEAP